LQANKVQELTDEQVENPRHTDVEAPARRSRLRWILAVAGVFLIAALVLVLAVFTGNDQQTQAGGVLQPGSRCTLQA
jgi:flagellar basal body-associated protein FliL